MSILFGLQFLVKHRIMQVQRPSNPPHLVVYDLFFFPKLEVLLNSQIWRCLNTLKEIRQYNFTSYKNRCLKSTLNNGKLTGISLLTAEWTILKKIKVLFIVHFCFSKYGISLVIFCKHCSISKIVPFVPFCSNKANIKINRTDEK